MRSAFLAVLAVGVAIAAPAAAREEYRDTASRFALTLPSGWKTVTDTGDLSVRVVIEGPAGSGALCNVAVVTSDAVARMSQAEINDAVVRGEIKDALRGEMQGVPELSYAYSVIDQDGMKAGSWDASYRIEIGPVRMRKVILITGANAYNMNCLAPVASFAQSAPAIEAALKSFRVLR